MIKPIIQVQLDNYLFTLFEKKMLQTLLAISMMSFLIFFLSFRFYST